MNAKTPSPARKVKVLYLHNSARFGDALLERVEALSHAAHVTTACLDNTPNLTILKNVVEADVVLHERHRNAAEEDRLDAFRDHARAADKQFQEIPGDTNDLATFLTLRGQLQEYGAHLATDTAPDADPVAVPDVAQPAPAGPVDPDASNAKPDPAPDAGLLPPDVTDAKAPAADPGAVDLVKTPDVTSDAQ